MRKWIPVLAAMLALGFTAASTWAVEVTLQGNPPSGSTISPGDTIQVSASIHNELAQPDIVEVRITMSLDDRTRARMGRLRLMPGQTIQTSFDFTIPPNANQFLTGPTTVTVTIQARSQRTGAVSTETLTYILEPNS
jgi:hypothetical protein